MVNTSETLLALLGGVGLALDAEVSLGVGSVGEAGGVLGELEVGHHGADEKDCLREALVELGAREVGGEEGVIDGDGGVLTVGAEGGGVVGGEGGEEGEVVGEGAAGGGSLEGAAGRGAEERHALGELLVGGGGLSLPLLTGAPEGLRVGGADGDDGRAHEYVLGREQGKPWRHGRGVVRTHERVVRELQQHLMRILLGHISIHLSLLNSLFSKKKTGKKKEQEFLPVY